MQRGCTYRPMSTDLQKLMAPRTSRSGSARDQDGAREDDEDDDVDDDVDDEDDGHDRERDAASDVNRSWVSVARALYHSRAACPEGVMAASARARASSSGT